MKRSDFRLELVQPDQRLLIHRWFMEKHVQETLRELNYKDILQQLEKFFQGKSQYIYWIGYYKNDPFAFLIGSPEKNSSITVDLIICDVNHQGRWFLTSLMREAWWHLDRFYKV